MFSAKYSAAQQDAAYTKVVTDRAAKIVNTLSITDSVLYNSVIQTLVSQYTSLNRLAEENKQAVAAIRSGKADSAIKAEQLKQTDLQWQQQLAQLHQQFLLQLKRQLNEAQVEKVKDGMTYNLLHVTYNAYLDMIPSLKEAEKAQIHQWLAEARELAMDGESSDRKHAIFGKYKGRINNYLSANGYDLTKEREEWQKRIKAKSTTASKN